ncbi:MAG: hypothetical protein M3Y66_00155 [Actinomycetota bacterium]|nr:hypothetical protein [Actinomycetota bacterium]
MSEPASANRPRQVTMAGWVGGAASLAMLLSVGEVMTKLRTVDQRQSIADFLAGQGGTSLNLNVDQALLIARIGLLVTGAASAATLVFAVFAVRRDKSARIAMSVLSVPLLMCGVFIDPFLAGFIAAAAVLLWTRAAGDWFAGRTPHQQPAAGSTRPPGVWESEQPERPPEHVPPSPPVSDAPPPVPAAFGSSYGEPTTTPVPPPGPYRPATEVSTVRPRQVTTACMIAWATSGVVFLMMVGTLLALQSDAVVQDMRTRIGANPALARSGMSFTDLVVMVRVAVVLVLVWALAAIVVAVLAYRRQNWARTTLAVSGCVAALLALVCSISFPGFLLVSAASVAATALLFNRASSRWYAAREQRPGAQTGPPNQPW